MLTVALTGGIGSGKSSAARILEDCGAGVLSLDDIARSVLEPGREAVAEVAGLWPGVVRDGTVDRRALADVVFADPVALERLNGIVHPPTWREARRRLAGLEAAGCEAAVVELALLAGSGREDAFHGNVVVEAPFGLRIDRLERHRGMSREAAAVRMASQRDPLPLADLVVDNGGSPGELERRVRDAWRDWLRPYASNLLRGERTRGDDRRPSRHELGRAVARLNHWGVGARRRGDGIVAPAPVDREAVLRAGFVPAAEGPAAFVSASPACRIELSTVRDGAMG